MRLLISIVAGIGVNGIEGADILGHLVLNNNLQGRIMLNHEGCWYGIIGGVNVLKIGVPIPQGTLNF